jgi:uncharacterized membrane protein
VVPDAEVPTPPGRSRREALAGAALILSLALAIAAIFLLSILVALFSPELATYCWLALFFVPIAGRALGKAR